MINTRRKYAFNENNNNHNNRRGLAFTTAAARPRSPRNRLGIFSRSPHASRSVINKNDVCSRFTQILWTNLKKVNENRYKITTVTLPIVRDVIFDITLQICNNPLHIYTD